MKKINIRRKYSFLVVLLFIAVCSYTNEMQAQVSVGCSDKSNLAALVDIKERSNSGDANTTKGIGIPRLKLIDAHNLYPMFQKDGINYKKDGVAYTKAVQDKIHIGMIVYHVEKSTLNGVGIYVWMGKRWQKMGK